MRFVIDIVVRSSVVAVCVCENRGVPVTLTHDTRAVDIL